MSPNNLRFVSVKIIVLTFISLMLSFEEPLANPSETANGSMSCTVKSNKVIDITEGKSSEYSGFKDGVKVGDALKFEYDAIFFKKVGWFQNVPSEYRPYITIDEAITTEYDYSQLSPHMLYFAHDLKMEARMLITGCLIASIWM